MHFITYHSLEMNKNISIERDVHVYWWREGQKRNVMQNGQLIKKKHTMKYKTDQVKINSRLTCKINRHRCKINDHLCKTNSYSPNWRLMAQNSLFVIYRCELSKKLLAGSITNYGRILFLLDNTCVLGEGGDRPPPLENLNFLDLHNIISKRCLPWKLTL